MDTSDRDRLDAALRAKVPDWMDSRAPLTANVLVDVLDVVLDELVARITPWLDNGL